MGQTCKTCGREIIWSKMPSGSRCPFDAKPTVVYSISEDGSAAIVAGKGHVSHFTTCPQAAQHSKPKPPRGIFDTQPGDVE